MTFRDVNGTTEVTYHVQLGVVSPRSGGSVHKAAAYHMSTRLYSPSGERFCWRRFAKEHIDGCVLMPPHAPREFADRDKLLAAWSGAETRQDGVPARWIEMQIPRAVPPEQRMQFARAVAADWVGEGRVVMIDIHNPRASDGGEQPHVHYLVSSRAVTPDGFSRSKLSEKPWRSRFGRDMRETIATRMNAWFNSSGLAIHVDARSFKERGDDTPTERNVSRRSWEAFKRRPDSPAAQPAAQTVAARADRRQLRAARRARRAAEAEMKTTAAEAWSRTPSVRPARRRRQQFDERLLPPLGGYVTAVTREASGATIELADGCRIADRGGYLTAAGGSRPGQLTDKAIAAMADLAARRWQDGVELTGDPAFRDRLAAAMAVRGIAVVNHATPPDHLLTDARRHLRPETQRALVADPKLRLPEPRPQEPAPQAGPLPRRVRPMRRPAVASASAAVETAQPAPAYAPKFVPPWATGQTIGKAEAKKDEHGQ